MIKIIILPHLLLCPYGKILKVDLLNISLCDILLLNNIDILHYCEKVGKCTTCSVVIKEGFYYFDNIDYQEKEGLFKINNFKNNIRLSCQMFLNNKYNIIISIFK